jgi:hypothetical protein
MAGEGAWWMVPGATARLKTFLDEGDLALLSGRLAHLAEPRAA